MAVTMWRMNGFWKRMALVLACGILLLHRCEGQDTPTLSPDSSAQTPPSGEGTTVTPDETDGTSLTNAPTTPQIEDTSDSGVMKTNSPTSDHDKVSSSTQASETAQPESASTTQLGSLLISEEPKIRQLYTFLDGLPRSHIDTKVTVKPWTHNTMIKRVVNVMCVDEDTVKDKDAVKIELSAFSSCEHTRQLVQKYGTEFCDSESCNFQIFQKENSNSAILTGQSVTDDLQGVTGKIDHLKEKLGVVKASPRWGKHQPTVLVALLLSGLIGAALLIAGYCWKTQRNSNAKGMKLPDDSYQVDEENQGNTLVSVAPLTPPEPQEKPSINGESPEAVKTQTPAATNGHSTTKTPVADTEL